MTQQPAGVNTDRPPGLDISVDRTAEIPIGVQLAWALRTRIRDGKLQPRERLPGLREVAEATGVNVNTVRAVYQRLEQEGLIDSQQGSGTFVAATPRRASAVTSIAADAAREALETGVDPREVAAALYVSGEPPSDEAAERRRLLREQIAALERTLGELEAKHPGVAPPAEVTRGIGPTLLSVDELEEVRTSLVRRLSVVQGSIDALAAETAVTQAREGRRARAAPRKQARGANPAQEGDRDGTATSKPSGRPRARTRPAPAGA